MIPLPNDDVTPPVTKMYFAEVAIKELNCNYGAQSYRMETKYANLILKEMNSEIRSIVHG